MNASLDWLRDFVQIDKSPGELRDLLTSRVATVDDVVSLRRDLAEIVVGRVVEAARHPDSDHLWVTKVDGGGSGLRSVVCGAPNVEAGALYPFAPVGTVLPGGMRIEKRKIRGAVSEGMLCSARELGLGTDHEGILRLDVDAAPGTLFLDAMPAGDSLFVVDVLPNRPDLLSHEGIAREIAAATGVPLRRPPLPEARAANGQDVASGAPPVAAVHVEIADPHGCQRYMGAHITGVTVGPSPAWLVERIEAVGGRSINNVVDATNYMLHGFGHPMHAFDLAKLDGRQIIVRRAWPGESLVTLDGVDRHLDEKTMVIADGARAQAIAGVIGGKTSEVTEATADIFLEVAAFDAAGVRATRRRLGISTDASYRFERGVDSSAMSGLIEYATVLIIAIAGGRLAGDIIDVGVSIPPFRAITLRPARVAQILGVNIPADVIASHLSTVGFTVDMRAGAMTVTVPGYRADVVGEVDLVEEVARLYGYSEFPSDIRPFRPGTVPDAPLDLATDRVRTAVLAAGLFEARPMPFVRTGDDILRVRNPLADDEAFLRTSILESLASRAEYNLAHMQRNVRLFEVGTVFRAERDPHTGAPAERLRVGAVVMGERRPAHFTEPRPPVFDEWDAKALGLTLARAAYPVSIIDAVPASDGDLWTLTVDAVKAGSVALLTIDAPVWASAAFGIEIDLESNPRVAPAPTVPEPAPGHAAPQSGNVGEAPTATFRRYSPIPANPAMQVDLALIVPDSVAAATVETHIRQQAGELLESLVLFDEFRGPGVQPGNRSIAWALTFRHRERTLRDREIEGRTAKILTSLETALGIRQRTS